MKHSASLLISACIAAAMCPASLCAQDTRSIGIWIGLGVATPGLGQEHEREMFLVAMQYRQAITRAPFVTVSYTPSVVPVMVLGRPAQPVGAVTCEVCPAGAGIPAFDSPDRSLGTGVIPAELELTFGGDAALAIVWGGGIGFLWVDDAVGIVSARRFNVLATARFGLRADLSRLGTLDLGARLQHLSHGGTVEQPGVSLVVWSVGWSPW